MDEQMKLFDDDDLKPKMIMNILDFIGPNQPIKDPISRNCFGSIYMIENMINSMRYIGQTKIDPPSGRITTHIRESKKGSTTNLHQAMREFGWSNFEVYWLHYKNVPVKYLDSIEKLYIRRYKTQDETIGYNMTSGGNSADAKKLSEASTAWWKVEEK